VRDERLRIITGNVAALDNALAALNPTELGNGRTIISRPPTWLVYIGHLSIQESGTFKQAASPVATRESRAAPIVRGRSLGTTYVAG
jgi:hypothetical protein